MTFKKLGKEIGKLVASKQKQYGDSVGKTGAILEALYPRGIFPGQYQDLLLIVRMLDKLARLANRDPGGKDKGGESPYSDLAGYALLGMRSDAKKG